jgi:hypothetical protein
MRTAEEPSVERRFIRARGGLDRHENAVVQQGRFVA